MSRLQLLLALHLFLISYYRFSNSEIGIFFELALFFIRSDAVFTAGVRNDPGTNRRRAGNNGRSPKSEQQIRSIARWQRRLAKWEPPQWAWSVATVLRTECRSESCVSDETGTGFRDLHVWFLAALSAAWRIQSGAGLDSRRRQSSFRLVQPWSPTFFHIGIEGDKRNRSVWPRLVHNWIRTGLWCYYITVFNKWEFAADIKSNDLFNDWPAGLAVYLASLAINFSK